MTGVWRLREFPGFHFDEAWAADFARRIAFEPGFFPLHAMSPQTAPWGHYFTAWAFRLFGADLFVYRASCLALAGAGLAASTGALAVRGYRRAAALLPWLAAGFPALVYNHRFAIELTSVHTFCFGLLLLTVAWRHARPRLAYPLGFLALFVGITSHVLFIALPLAWVIWRLTTELPRLPDVERRWGAALGAALAPFFFSIYLGTPWKAKAIALLLADALLVAALLWRRGAGLSPSPVWQRNFRRASWPLLAIFGFNALVFADGHWSALTQSGQLTRPWLIGTLPLLALAGLASRWRTVPREWVHGATALIIATGLVIVVPAPRYFETSFILWLSLLSVAFETARPWTVVAFALMFVGLGAGQLAAPPEPFRVRDFRLLALRESSRDFAPKDALLAALQRQGCAIEDVQVPDTRLRATLVTLQALQQTRPPNLIAGNCPIRWHVGWRDRSPPPDSATVLYDDAGLTAWSESKL